MTNAEKRLDRIIDRNIQQAKRRTEHKEREAQERQARHDAFWEREDRLLEQKRKLHKEILHWHEEFTKTPRYTKLFETSCPLGIRHDRIEIFVDTRGDKPPEEHSHGCWSRVHAEQPKKLHYTAGYKMGTDKTIDLTDPACIETLTHHYLKRLRDHLVSGAVYNTLANSLKR